MMARADCICEFWDLDGFTADPDCPVHRRSAPTPKQREERDANGNSLLADKLSVYARQLQDGESLDAGAPFFIHEAATRLRTHSPEERERHGWQVEHGVTCVVCPDCAFTFDADHEDDCPEGGYTCPNCPPEEPAGYCVRLRCDDLPPTYQGTFYESNERDAAEEDAEAMRHGPGEGWKAEVVPLYSHPIGQPLDPEDKNDG